MRNMILGIYISQGYQGGLHRACVACVLGNIKQFGYTPYFRGGGSVFFGPKRLAQEYGGSFRHILICSCLDILQSCKEVFQGIMVKFPNSGTPCAANRFQ